MSDQIDWKYWRQLKEVKAWEAAFLSLNINPSEFEFGSFEYDDFVDSSISCRIRLITSNMTRLTARALSLTDPELHAVRLKEVAALSIYDEWERTPPPFKELGKHVLLAEHIEHWAKKPYWSERELESLCVGVLPNLYADRNDVAPKAERNQTRQKISLAIKSGELLAEPYPDESGARVLYGDKWKIEHVSAVRWAMENDFPNFPNFIATNNAYKKYAQQAIDKVAAGRYTLDEVAEELALKSSIDKKRWSAILIPAVRSRELRLKKSNKFF